MDSQNIEEDYETNVNQVISQSEEISNSSPDSEADSIEGRMRQDDPGEIQDSTYEDSCQHEDQRQPTVTEKDNTNLLSLPFPRKLWSIVNNESFNSVKWTEEGDTIMIELDLFQREFLHLKGAEKIFETNSLESFIHQLNMYGFRKICPETSVVSSEKNRKIMMFQNFNFQRDNPGLLEYIWGKKDLERLNKALCVPIPLRSSQEPASKKRKIPTRWSPRFYHQPEDDGEESKKANDQASKGNQGFVFSTVWAMKAISESSLGKKPCGEPCNQTAEGTSDNILCEPPTATGVQDMEEAPSASSSGYPIVHSMMSLYNNCYSVLLSALFKGPTNEPPDEEEHGSSSDYKCVLCQPIRNSPRL